MHIEHIAIWSKDIEKLRDFYTRYFHAKSNNKYTNSKKKFSSYFLTFASGARLEVMQREHIPDSKNPVGTDAIGITHIAFSVGSKTNVVQLTEQLQKSGFVIVSEPRTTGDGYFESVVLDPDGNPLEITL